MDGGRVTVNGQLMRERARKQRKEEQGREGGRAYRQSTSCFEVRRHQRQYLASSSYAFA